MTLPLYSYLYECSTYVGQQRRCCLIVVTFYVGVNSTCVGYVNEAVTMAICQMSMSISQAYITDGLRHILTAIERDGIGYIN